MEFGNRGRDLGGDELKFPIIDYRLLHTLEYAFIAYEVQDVDGSKVALPVCSAPSQDNLSEMLDAIGNLPDNLQYTHQSLLNATPPQECVDV